MEMRNPLVSKYPDLPGSKPVERAVSARLRSGEAGAKSKDERVDVYMQRLEKILSKDQRSERGLDPYAFLKAKLLKAYTLDDQDPVTLERVARGLYESEKRIALERGQGAEVQHLSPEQESNLIEHYKPAVHEKAEIQRRSLSYWLDYLQKNDGDLPMWFRYFVVRSLGNMGSFNKEKLQYEKRSPTTVAPFPELNSEALGYVFKLLNHEVQPSEAIKKAFEAKDFPKLYAYAQVEVAGKTDRTSIEGTWKKYPQGSDYRVLESDLAMKGTGWCTAQGSAKNQLEQGDFYVFYSKAANGANTEPRIAIRMDQQGVAEVRGIAPQQEVEPALVPAAREKFKDLPGGEKYEKKASDMKRLTSIAKKTEKNEPLTKDELIFLYEIDSKIESFGYQRDPRIDDLRKTRDPKIDAPIVLECEPKQIATSEKEITPDTKAYIGPLFPGIFKLNLENIYTRFPEGKIHFYELEIGGMTKNEYVAAIKKEQIEITKWAQSFLDSKDFTVSKTKKELDLVRLTCDDLGFPEGAMTVKEIYERAEKFGLELCPPEVGPAERLMDANQPIGDEYWIAMKPIAGSGGRSYVFHLYHGTAAMRLCTYDADDGFNGYDQWVFCRRK